MDRFILLRSFEERDIDFIYKCKNDEQLNSMIVGQFHHFSYEEAKKWVEGCMVDDPRFKFWAVCSNDEEKRIVGWTAISQVDKVNKSAFFHSIVIGDPQYRNGFPWVEVQHDVVEYVFKNLGLHRLEFSCLTEHPSSMSIGPVMFFEQEGVKRHAVYKNGRYYDEAFFALLENEYYLHKNNGEYEIESILGRYAKFIRKSKKNG